nr:hypothetical protein CQNTEFLM_CQNTEFLM_CDS_0002 [uncultured phage]
MVRFGMIDIETRMFRALLILLVVLVLIERLHIPLNKLLLIDSLIH